jgi:hypothetical protein
MSDTRTEKPAGCTATDIAVLASFGYTGMSWDDAYGQYLHQDSPREKADYRLRGSKADGYGFDTVGIYSPHCDVLDKAERDRRQIRYETKAEAEAELKSLIADMKEAVELGYMEDSDADAWRVAAIEVQE